MALWSLGFSLLALSSLVAKCHRVVEKTVATTRPGVLCLSVQTHGPLLRSVDEPSGFELFFGLFVYSISQVRVVRFYVSHFSSFSSRRISTADPGSECCPPDLNRKLRIRRIPPDFNQRRAKRRRGPPPAPQESECKVKSNTNSQVQFRGEGTFISYANPGTLEGKFYLKQNAVSDVKDLPRCLCKLAKAGMLKRND